MPKIKKIIYEKEAREKLKSGVNRVANAVTTTLGPKGRNVALGGAIPEVVHDGVTVAKEVKLEDPFEDVGASLAIEAASKTNDVAGDGTTTSMLLTQAIVNESLKSISSGVNPMTLKRELKEALGAVEKQIKESAIKVTTKEEKTQVATVSAQDEEIGNMIAEAMEKVGDNGVITVDESKGFGMELVYKEGMQFDKGYASPYFVTDVANQTAEIKNSNVLLVDMKVSNVEAITPFLETVTKDIDNLVVIANDVEGEALTTFVMNKLQGRFNFLAIRAPGFGDRRKAMLEDIATLTGATLISEDTGRELSSVTTEDLGKAEKVVCTKDETTIVGGKGDKNVLKQRISQINKQVEQASSEYEKERLMKRAAKLSGGVAVIQVGAATESELKEKKLRVEDAVNATKAAVEEGIVVGGGVALLHSREILKDSLDVLGHKIIYDSLKYPIIKLLKNAGLEPGEVIAGLDGENIGYNVLTDRYENMIESGVIDPVKVTLSALKNAVSVAIMIITTDCIIVDKDNKDAQD